MDDFSKISKKIIEKINSVNRILMHCHVRPDPDSVGSVLGMKLALEKLGKVVTVISGDDFPLDAVSFLPKFGEIVTKSFDQVDFGQYDLYLCLDTGGREQITYKKKVEFPLSIPTIVIDHHKTNPEFGEINLVMPEISSCAEIVYLLLKDWNIDIDKEIATCLYTGINADTGGFRFATVTADTYRIAADLIERGANFSEIMFKLSSIKFKNLLAFAKCLGETKSYFNNRLVIAKIPLTRFHDLGIFGKDISHTKELIAFQLSSCVEAEISVVIYEYDKLENSSISIRSNNPKKIWDVSQLASAMGGGGHRQAAGGKYQGNINEAEKFFLEVLKSIYPEFEKC